MTVTWLDRLRQAGENVTPGKWWVDADSVIFFAPPIANFPGLVGSTEHHADAGFIALARNLWPLLVNVIEAADNHAENDSTVNFGLLCDALERLEKGVPK